MNFKMPIFLVLVLVGLGVFGIKNVFSQDTVVRIENPLKYGTIPEILAAIANFIFWIGIIIMPIVIIIGGIIFATSGGEPEKVKTGRRLLLWSSIGLIILVLARVLAAFIKSILGG